MRKPLALFAAASLSLGVFAYLGYDSAVFGDDTQKAADTSGTGSSKDPSSTAGGQSSSSSSGLRSSSSAYGSSGSLPQGVTKSTQSDDAGIRQAIAKVTADVLKEDGISQLSNCFAKSDQQRLTNLKADQINEKIKQLQQTFKQKYNKDFQPDQAAFGDQLKELTIVQGEVSNPALMSNWPVNSSGSSSGSTPSRGSSNLRSDASSTSGSGLSGSSSSSGGIGASASSTDRNSSTSSGASADRNSSSSSGVGASATTDRNSSSSSSGGLSGSSSTSGVQKGFGVAIVTFPASQGAPEVNVSLVRESAGAAGASGSSTGTGSNTGGSSSSSPRSDASSTSGGANSAGSTSTADRSSTSGAGTSSTADRSSTSGAGRSTSGFGASAQAGASQWKIDLPDTMTAEKLQTNLAKHLDEVNQMKDQWPTDANEAYKVIAHHVFMAFYDVDASAAKAAPGATGIRGSSGTFGTGSDRGTTGTGSGSSSGTGANSPGSTTGTRQRQ